MAEAAFSPGLDTVAPSRALELSGSVNAASSSLVLLDVLGVSACHINQSTNQLNNQVTFLVFRTHQGSQETITGEKPYTKH